VLTINTPNVLPGGFYLSGATINNSGTVNHNWDGFGYGLYLYKGSVINNLVGANWNVITDVLVAAGDSSANSFNNTGALNKTGGTGISNWSVCLNGPGSVNIATGTMDFDGFCPASKVTGTISISSPGSLTYAQEGTLSGGKVTGTGSLTFNSSAGQSGNTVLAGDYNIGVKTQVLGGTLEVTGSSTISSLDVSGGGLAVNGSASIGSLQLNGTVSGTGEVDVTGTMTWTGGSITGMGVFDIEDLSLSSSSSVSLQLGGRILAINAKVDLSGDITFTLAPGSNTAVGQVFKAMTFADSFAGVFGDIGLPSLGDGDSFKESLTSSGLSFTIAAPTNGN
jgi:hypothetical protein